MLKYLKKLTFYVRFVFKCPGKFTDISSILTKEENSKDNFVISKHSPDHDYAKVEENTKDTFIMHSATQNTKSYSGLRRTLSFNPMEQTQRASEMNSTEETIDVANSCQVGMQLVIPGCFLNFSLGQYEVKTCRKVRARYLSYIRSFPTGADFQ